MKLLFAMDHRFEVHEGQIFTLGGKYPYSLWQQYLEVFDELVVLGRGGNLTSDHGKLVLSAGPRVRHVLMGNRRGVRRLGEVIATPSKVREEVAKADVVIARLPSEIGLAACAAAKAYGKPYLTEVVASAHDGLWNHGSLAARLYAPILERRTASAVWRAPAAHYVTERFLQTSYPTKGHAVAASDVNLQPFGHDVLQARLQRIEGQGQRPLVLGTIGSLVSQMKGVHIALAALKEAAPNLPPFVYRVLGEGDPSLYKTLARDLGLEDKVYFDGVLPNGAAVAGWLDQVDIYLQPSYQEGLPRALVEALSRGCPAIASTVGGNPELLPAERLHKPGDAETLARQILAIATQPAEVMAREATTNWERAQQFAPAKLAEQKKGALLYLRSLKEQNHG